MKSYNGLEGLTERQIVFRILRSIDYLDQAAFFRRASRHIVSQAGQQIGKSIRGNSNLKYLEISELLGVERFTSENACIASIKGAVEYLSNKSGQDYGWIKGIIGSSPKRYLEVFLPGKKERKLLHELIAIE